MKFRIHYMWRDSAVPIHCANCNIVSLLLQASFIIAYSSVAAGLCSAIAANLFFKGCQLNVRVVIKCPTIQK